MHFLTLYRAVMNFDTDISGNSRFRCNDAAKLSGSNPENTGDPDDSTSGVNLDGTDLHETSAPSAISTQKSSEACEFDSLPSSISTLVDQTSQSQCMSLSDNSFPAPSDCAGHERSSSAPVFSSKDLHASNDGMSQISLVSSHKHESRITSESQSHSLGQLQEPSLPMSTSPPSHPLLDCRYRLGPRLGRGCFATVYKATRLSDNVTVAIKAVEKKRLDAETAILLDNELQILRAVSQHPGIVTLLDHIDTDTHMFFALEYVDGGPLLDRIVKRRSFSENDARILLRTILLTLEFLSELGCVHRDIKPENILVDNYSLQWPVKLTDFGLSAKMQPDQLLYAALGTPLFVAPEILIGQGYDCSCDMWSLGVVIYIVLCGYPPFPFYEGPENLITAIVNGRYDFPSGEWDHVSQDAKDVVRRMLEIDPSKRITPSVALRHRWVSRSQSTTDLPNQQLKSFNARRKLKASFVAVRTTRDFMNTINRIRKSPTLERRQQQKDLLRDVERSRVLLEQMGMGYTNQPASHHKRNSYDSDMAVSRGSRKSLVLPVNGLDNASTCRTPGRPTNLKMSTFVSPIIGLNASSSQIMESKAKAMVAEVNQSRLLADNTNPFMAESQVDVEKTSKTAGGNEQHPNPRPKPLASLDFGLLDL